MNAVCEHNDCLNRATTIFGGQFLCLPCAVRLDDEDGYAVRARHAGWDSRYWMETEGHWANAEAAEYAAEEDAFEDAFAWAE